MEITFLNYWTTSAVKYKNDKSYARVCFFVNIVKTLSKTIQRDRSKCFLDNFRDTSTHDLVFDISYLIGANRVKNRLLFYNISVV